MSSLNGRSAIHAWQRKQDQRICKRDLTRLRTLVHSLTKVAAVSPFDKGKYAISMPTVSRVTSLERKQKRAHSHRISLSQVSDSQPPPLHPTAPAGGQPPLLLQLHRVRPELRCVPHALCRASPYPRPAARPPGHAVTNLVATHGAADWSSGDQRNATLWAAEW